MKYLSCDGICILFEMPKNRTNSFTVLFRFKIDHVIFPRNAPFLYVRKPRNAPFSHLILKMENVGHFKDFEELKVGLFEEKHVTSV